MMRNLLGVALIVVTINAYSTPRPSWGHWDRANSVAKEGVWLVIRQPDSGFCYLKQGFKTSPTRLNLYMKKDHILYLITPYWNGLTGSVTYWVDRGRKSTLSGSSKLNFPKTLTTRLRKGKTITFRFTPKGKTTTQHTYSLRGFNRARKWLGTKTCKKKTPDRASNYN